MEIPYDELVAKVLALEATVKKIIALPQLSKLAGRDAEILNSRVKGTKSEYLASPALKATLEDTMGNALNHFAKRGALEKN